MERITVLMSTMGLCPKGLAWGIRLCRLMCGSASRFRCAVEPIWAAPKNWGVAQEIQYN